MSAVPVDALRETVIETDEDDPPGSPLNRQINGVKPAVAAKTDAAGPVRLQPGLTPENLDSGYVREPGDASRLADDLEAAKLRDAVPLAPPNRVRPVEDGRGRSQAPRVIDRDNLKARALPRLSPPEALSIESRRRAGGDDDGDAAGPVEGLEAAA